MAEDQTSEDKKTSKIVALICVVVIVVVGAIVIFKGDSEAPNKTATKSAAVSLYLDPATKTVAKGEELSVSVWADSGDKSVNAVEADLTYPSADFDFVSVDDTGSAFSVAVAGQGADGTVTIVRGAPKNTKGKALIAKLNLKAKDVATTGKISFAKGSALASNVSHKDILTKTVSGTYTIK